MSKKHGSRKQVIFGVRPMEYLIIVAIIAIVLFVVIIIREKKINDKVLANSKKIALLLKLNKEIEFYQITDYFQISKHYDNKRNYSQIKPAYLMTAEIRSNIAFFSDYVTKIKENRRKKIQYENKIQDILSTEYSIDYSKLNLSCTTYKRHEEKLFFKRVLSPVVNCSVTVNMTYSSPKGKVNLSKSNSFTFNDLFACFESVSRSRLDKETYSRLVAVERGEISDSLRYDILNRDNFTCVICGASSSQGVRLHVDHIVPISKGGKSVPSNLRTLCERCNIGKSNKIENVPSQPAKSKMNDNLTCQKCGAKLIIRKGKYGEFYGCSNYPHCKFTKNL
jgi:hypothetical protein